MSEFHRPCTNLISDFFFWLASRQNRAALGNPNSSCLLSVMLGFLMSFFLRMLPNIPNMLKTCTLLQRDIYIVNASMFSSFFLSHSSCWFNYTCTVIELYLTASLNAISLMQTLSLGYIRLHSDKSLLFSICSYSTHL